MIVKNRKTQKEYVISKEDYANLVARKIHRNFQVINDSDVPKGKIAIPRQIEEYQHTAKELKIKKIEPITKTDKTNE